MKLTIVAILLFGLSGIASAQDSQKKGGMIGALDEVNGGAARKRPDGGQQLDEKKAPEQKKPEDKKPEDKKPEDKKPEDKKPEPKKPDDKKPEPKKPDESKPISPVEYSIKSGDSLAKVAKDYGMSHQQLLALTGPDGLTNAERLAKARPKLDREVTRNGKPVFLIFPGEKLYLPLKETVTVTATADPIETIPAPIVESLPLPRAR
jgi:LysM repeat protein